MVIIIEKNHNIKYPIPKKMGSKITFSVSGKLNFPKMMVMIKQIKQIMNGDNRKRCFILGLFVNKIIFLNIKIYLWFN